MFDIDGMCTFLQSVISLYYRPLRRIAQEKIIISEPLSKLHILQVLFNIPTLSGFDKTITLSLKIEINPYSFLRTHLLTLILAYIWTVNLLKRCWHSSAYLFIHVKLEIDECGLLLVLGYKSFDPRCRHVAFFRLW